MSHIRRIPIIPGKWAWTKISSLYCDDVTHYTSAGEPKTIPNSDRETRHPCHWPHKQLLAELDEHRFCVTHDPGNGKKGVSTLSGQWWAYKPKDQKEINAIVKEFNARMGDQARKKDWWKADVKETGVNSGESAPKSTSGLMNNVPVTVPTGLKSEGDIDEPWEMEFGDEVDDYEFVDIPKQ